MIGTGETALKVGGETVIFRHEKTFVNKPGIGLLITDAMDESEVDARLKKFKALAYDRVGLVLKADIMALKDTTGDSAKLIKLIEKAKGMGLTTLALMSDKKDVLIDCCQGGSLAQAADLLCHARILWKSSANSLLTTTAPWQSEGKILTKSLT